MLEAVDEKTRKQLLFQQVAWLMSGIRPETEIHEALNSTQKHF